MYVYVKWIVACVCVRQWKRFDCLILDIFVAEKKTLFACTKTIFVRNKNYVDLPIEEENVIPMSMLLICAVVIA